MLKSAAALTVISALGASAFGQTVEIELLWDSGNGPNGSLILGETVTVGVYATFLGGGGVISAADFTMSHTNSSVSDAVIGDAGLDLGTVVAATDEVVATGLGHSNIFASFDLDAIHLFDYELTVTTDADVTVSILSPIFNTIEGFAPVDHTLSQSVFVIDVDEVPSPGSLAIAGLGVLAVARRRR